MSVAQSLTIEYWELNSQCCPVADFILGVEPVGARVKIRNSINYLGEVGMRLITNPKIFRKITGYDNLYELRISWGKIAYRILVVIRDAIAYLVHAFVKQRRNERHQLQIGAQRRDLIFSHSWAN